MNEISYNPDALLEIEKFDIEYLNIDGITFYATIYKPVDQGLYPSLIDIHGGAWQGGSRADGEYIDKSLASSGMVIAAIDFRVAPDHVFPSQVKDVNYGIRWWKNKCSEYDGSNNIFGGLGISSGGHTLMLNSLTPNNPLFNDLQSSEKHDEYDSAIDYYIGVSPVLDSYERYVYAKKVGREDLIQGSEGYFGNKATMKDGSPQFVLDRQEFTKTPNALIIHGTEDANIPNHIPIKFAETYSKYGGSVDLRMFEGMEHSFARTPMPESHQAIKIAKEFISNQMKPS
jgi:acetyl esterase